MLCNFDAIINNPSQDNSVETRREVAIRGLMVYLREKEEELFKEEVNQTPLYFT